MSEFQNNYVRELNKDIYKLYLNALVNLPFTMTDEQVEPNMITIRRKKDENENIGYTLQIYRENDEEYGFTMCPGGRVNPKTLNLDKSKLITSDDYFIELTHGVNLADPDNYQ